MGISMLRNFNILVCDLDLGESTLLDPQSCKHLFPFVETGSNCQNVVTQTPDFHNGLSVFGEVEILKQLSDIEAMR